MSEVVETDRKLATIRQISAIDPILDADAIDVATVDGWKVVVKKGDFSVGDLCVYFEIDSWVPATVAPFLNRGRKFNGVEGERLRTKKLRGQISQGLVLPFSSLSVAFNPDEMKNLPFEIGDDVTQPLGIQKFEKSIPASLQGVARGNFPGFIRKTDQERIQNLKKYLGNWIENRIKWEITEKIDGSSMTVYINDGIFGVCSRNLDLVETEGNAYWDIARKLNIEHRMTEFIGHGGSQLTQYCRKNFAIQGELVGPGIQGNKYGLKETAFYVFDIFDIDAQEYLPHYERWLIATHLLGLDHVPLIDAKTINDGETVDSLLTLADGQSIIGNKSGREGLVYKNLHDGSMSFKTISNKWLLKNEE
jgi:RNA ligase (TIGR02306 family)